MVVRERLPYYKVKGNDMTSIPLTISEGVTPEHVEVIYSLTGGEGGGPEHIVTEKVTPSIKEFLESSYSGALCIQRTYRQITEYFENLEGTKYHTDEMQMWLLHVIFPEKSEDDLRHLIALHAQLPKVDNTKLSKLSERKYISVYPITYETSEVLNSPLVRMEEYTYMLPKTKCNVCLCSTHDHVTGSCIKCSIKFCLADRISLNVYPSAKGTIFDPIKCVCLSPAVYHTNQPDNCKECQCTGSYHAKGMHRCYGCGKVCYPTVLYDCPCPACADPGVWDRTANNKGTDAIYIAYGISTQPIFALEGYKSFTNFEGKLFPLDLVKEAAEFYTLLNLSLLEPDGEGNITPPWPLHKGYPKKLSLTEITSKLETKAIFLAEQFAVYLELACLGESRHIPHGLSSKVKYCPTISDYIGTAADRTRISVWYAWSDAYNLYGTDLYRWLIDVFKLDGWDDGIGGRNWAACASVLYAFRQGKISNLTFVDSAFGLQHNSSSVFSKAWNIQGLGQLLDLVRIGSPDAVCVLVHNVSDDMKKFLVGSGMGPMGKEQFISNQYVPATDPPTGYHYSEDSEDVDDDFDDDFDSDYED